MVRTAYILLTLWFGIFHVSAKEVENADSLLTLKGTVKDARSKKRLANVNVSVIGKEVGTMTNDDGVFAIKINKEDMEGRLHFSCIGYANGSMAYVKTRL